MGGGDGTWRERELMIAAAAEGEEGICVCEKDGREEDRHGESRVMVERREKDKDREREDIMRSIMSQCGCGKHAAVMMAIESWRGGRKEAG
jgi:hypothetical protein